MRLASVIWFVWCVLGAGAVQGAGGTAEVYSAGNSDLEVFVQAVRGLVGPEDTVVADRKQHRVVVVTSEENHRAIAALAAALDRPAQNIRVDVSIRDAGESDEQSIGVTGRGGVLVRDGDVHTSVKLQPRLRQTRTETGSSALQSLLVTSGGEAVLRVGESVPYLEWLEAYGVGGGYIQQRVAWQDVGSFLAVQPTVLGDGGEIRVRLTPILKGQVGGRPHQVRFAELATEVTVGNGQSIDLGGLTTDNTFYSRFLVGVDRSRSARTLTIELTPTLLDASGKPAGP